MSGALKRGDAVIILSVLTACLCLVLLRYAPSECKKVNIYESGELTHVAELSTDSGYSEIKINGGTIIIENGTVRYANADCPDKLCEKFGRLSFPGDTASCVPNKTVVTIVSGESEPDIITH